VGLGRVAREALHRQLLPSPDETVSHRRHPHTESSAKVINVIISRANSSIHMRIASLNEKAVYERRNDSAVHSFETLKVLPAHGPWPSLKARGPMAGSHARLATKHASSRDLYESPQQIIASKEAKGMAPVARKREAGARARRSAQALFPRTRRDHGNRTRPQSLRDGHVRDRES
jgi:hypothetical protein